MRDAVLEYLMAHRGNGREIARALGAKAEDVYAALVELEADGLIDTIKVRPRVVWEACR